LDLEVSSGRDEIVTSILDANKLQGQRAPGMPGRIGWGRLRRRRIKSRAAVMLQASLVRLGVG
jgi:hypothetical protein